MEQYVNTAKHKENLKRWKGQRQRMLTDMNNPKDKSHKKMLNWMVLNNIALDKLNNKTFTDFLVKHINKPIPCHMTIRRQLDSVYDQKMNYICQELGDNNIWLSTDECTAEDGRCVANVIIEILKGEECGKSFLVNSVDMNGKVNNSTICTIIDDTIKILWHGNFDREKFLFLVTDGAPYMKLAGQNLEVFYPKMIHITCMAHLINRIADCIRMNHKLTDKFISEVKKIFTKCRSRTEIFKTFASELPIPPKPVITRWATWLNAAFYYAKNYDVISNIIKKFDPKDALCIEKSQKLIKRHEL